MHPRLTDPAQTEAGANPRILNVLVVDDSVDSAQTLAEFVGGLGHRVRTANDGRSALRMLKDDSVDLLLLDLSLPDINGYDLAVRIGRENEQAPRIVAITGHSTPEHRERARRAGIHTFLVKPVDPAQLAAILGEGQS